MRLNTWLGCVFALLLLACGGGEQTTSAAGQLEILRTQAAAKEAEARQLGVDEPCTTNDQCGALFFAATAPECASGGQLDPKFVKLYSLVSANAAQAKQAADAQGELAAQARALYPKSDLFCPAVIPNPIVPACQAGKCVDQMHL